MPSPPWDHGSNSSSLAVAMFRGAVLHSPLSFFKCQVWSWVFCCGFHSLCQKSRKNNMLEDGHCSVLKRNNELMCFGRQEWLWWWLERSQGEARGLCRRQWVRPLFLIIAAAAANTNIHCRRDGSNVSSLHRGSHILSRRIYGELCDNGSLIPEHMTES